jgi:integrase
VTYSERMPRSRRRRGHVEELPSGRYRAVVYAGTDPLTGRLKYLRETVDTLRAADQAVARLQRQVDERRHPKSDVTVAEAIGQWLEVVELADTTRDRYGDLVRLHILPTFGDLAAARIDAELLERFYARLHRCRDLCSGRPPKGHQHRPLSSSTTRKIHYIIRGALDRAVRWRHLDVNPAAMAEAPIPRRTRPDPPSAAEASAVLNEAWGDPDWGLLLWLTMITGCRRGELCSLRWAHLDVERQRLWVHRSTSQSKAGVKDKETKTDTERRIGLDSGTMELLLQHRTKSMNQVAAVGGAWGQDSYLFSSSPDYSTPLLPHAVTQRYRRMAKRLGLRSTRLHSLRHYSATELIAAGVDLRTVAERLGHGGGGATTLKVYAGWVAEADRRAAETMAAIMPTPVANPPAPRGPYQSIAESLREDIRAGRLAPGDQFPTIVELAARFGVAAGTAHRAMALLASEGLISVARGRRAMVERAP